MGTGTGQKTISNLLELDGYWFWALFGLGRLAAHDLKDRIVAGLAALVLVLGAHGNIDPLDWPRRDPFSPAFRRLPLSPGETWAFTKGKVTLSSTISRLRLLAPHRECDSHSCRL